MRITRSPHADAFPDWLRKLKAMTKGIFVVYKNGVVSGDLRPATNTWPDSVKRSHFH
jgi:hypothetical protein